MKILPRVLHYLRPHRKLAAFSVVLMLAGAAFGILLPWPLKFLVDNVLNGDPMPPALAGVLGPLAADRTSLLITVVVAGFMFALAHGALTVLDNYVNTKIDQSMVLDFRSDLFEHAQRLSLTFHDQKRSGSLIYAINAQADAAARLVMAIPPLVQSSLTLIGMLWVTYLINPTLALLSLSVAPFLYLSVRLYVTRIQRRLEEVKRMEGESLSIIHEALLMLRVIVAFGREDYEHRRFRKQGEATIKARIRVTVWQTLFKLAVTVITAAGTALVLGIGAFQVMHGKLTVGQLLVVMAYIALIYHPLEAISNTLGSIQDQFVSLRVAFRILDTDPEIKDAPDAAEIGRAAGRVTFEAVDFHYQGRTDTLRGVSFEALPGLVVAIVGPTGAGKTTLVSLIPRFYEQQKGRILLDGADIRGLTLKSLRAQISVVLQEPLLFSGSIAANIRYGRLDATMEEVMAAAKAANAHDFIMRLPQQYDTELGERGVKLSGGERQRIAVARAFLKDAPILILDEPTSSIDSKTEAVILDALDRLMVGRTTFLIAHRLSTIRKADVILVVDRGRVVAQGTHAELLRRGGLYKQLHEMQTKAMARSESERSGLAGVSSGTERA
jgi:ATP-binding cassette subfamily B protein/subfamily B ATP-binding cassette protein MsbA